MDGVPLVSEPRVRLCFLEVHTRLVLEHVRKFTSNPTHAVVGEQLREVSKACR